MHKPLRGKPPWEKQRDLSFGLKQGLATHLSAQGFPTSPTCCSAWCLRENTCLVTCTHSHHLMCQSLRSLFKHGRTKFLGRFLPWGGRTKMEAKGLAEFQLLLSQWCSWESWWHCYLSKGSQGHQLPVPVQCLLPGSWGMLGYSSSLNILTPPRWVREQAATLQMFSFTQKTRISLNVLSKHIIKQEIIIIYPRLFWSDGQICS